MDVKEMIRFPVFVGVEVVASIINVGSTAAALVITKQ
jgi:hypothetical protein